MSSRSAQDLLKGLQPVGRWLATVVVVLGLVSCGTPPWKVASSSASPHRSASASTKPATRTPVPVTTPKPTQAEVQNDLATGSAKRTLLAGGVRIKINYWSTLGMGDWTAAAAKPLSLSASAKFVDGSRQNIFMSRASVNIAVEGPKGALAAPDPLVDAATVAPGYLMKSPSSYLQVFTIPALPTAATSVTLTLTYEVLAQSAPKSKTFSKQTASNDLVIAIQP